MSALPDGSYAIDSGQTTAPMASHDIALPSIEQDFDFSAFLHMRDEDIEPDISMTDPSLISTCLGNAAQNAANAFDMDASSFFDEAVFSMPDPADFSAPVFGRNNEHTGSHAMFSINTQQGPGIGAQTPGYGGPKYPLTGDLLTGDPVTEPSGPAPYYPEPGACLPVDLNLEMQCPGHSRQHPEAQLPTAPVAEMPGQENDNSHAAIPADLPAPRVRDAFPRLDHGILERQKGMPQAAPQGCTDAARSGWDSRGWWYQGKHDSCPIPTVHRHDRSGLVSFNGLGGVLELVTEVMARK